MRPVANSTSGYIGEMGSPQLRHLPRRISQPKTGMLSWGLIGLRQRGQREPGETMERPSGMREMQTFRKLPMTMPKRKKKNGITVSTVPQAGRRLNAGQGRACRMANVELEFAGMFDEAAGFGGLPFGERLPVR
jgi:hypothetical protein